MFPLPSAFHFSVRARTSREPRVRAGALAGAGGVSCPGPRDAADRPRRRSELSKSTIPYPDAIRRNNPKLFPTPDYCLKYFPLLRLVRQNCRKCFSVIRFSSVERLHVVQHGVVQNRGPSLSPRSLRQMDPSTAAPTLFRSCLLWRRLRPVCAAARTRAAAIKMGRSKGDDNLFRRVLPRTAHPRSITGRGCRVENPAETGGCRSLEYMSSSIGVTTTCPVSSDRVFSRPGRFLSSAASTSRRSGKLPSSERLCTRYSALGTVYSGLRTRYCELCTLHPVL